MTLSQRALTIYRCLNRCFLVDDSGFIIAHHDWTDSSRIMYDVHITQQEPEIAEILIENGYMSYSVCINVLDIRIQYFWKVRLLAGKPLKLVMTRNLVPGVAPVSSGLKRTLLLCINISTDTSRRIVHGGV